MPKVSIIIPAYNSSRFISEAIKSIFNQTFKDFEIIVIDDGSTDDTKDVLKPFIHQIQYIFKENGGVASARNVGIRMSKGKYIAFLDYDDIWLPNKLELQVQILDTCPQVGLVHTDNLFLINNETSSHTCKSKIKDKKLLSGRIFKSLLMQKFFLTCSTVMVRKVCFDKVGLFDISLPPADDFDMWLRITKEWDCAYIDIPLVKYRIHSSNISRNHQKMHSATFAVLTKIFTDSLFTEDTQLLRPRVLSNFYYAAGASNYCAGDLRQAKLNLVKSLKYFPFRIDSYLCLIKCMLGDRWLRLLKVITKRIK